MIKVYHMSKISMMIRKYVQQLFRTKTKINFLQS